MAFLCPFPHVLNAARLEIAYSSLHITKEFYSYHDPPLPPPEPLPEDPPPEDLLPELPELLDDGLDVIAFDADAIVEFIKEENAALLNAPVPPYQSGARKAIVSNFLIHLSDTPST